MLESKSSGFGGGVSPGGFEFGIVGFQWADPIPKSMTFFLDNTALVADQYGRPIRRAVSPDGVETHFADEPPEGNREGTVHPRPQFGTHQQVIQALRDERVDWLSYLVRYFDVHAFRTRTGLTYAEALRVQAQLAKEGRQRITVERTIVTAGWPQLPYEELRKLPTDALPPVMHGQELQEAFLHELMKIRDPDLRKAAMRFRREQYDGVVAEVEALMEG